MNVWLVLALVLTAPVWVCVAYGLTVIFAVPVVFGPWAVTVDTFFGTRICDWYFDTFIPKRAFEEDGW